MTASRHRLARRLLVAVLALTAPPAAADTWRVGDDARLGFSGNYQGEAFEGRFERFDAAIRFDPEALGEAAFRVEIDMASARTGVADYDASLLEPDFFDAPRFPKAVFTASGFSAVGGDDYSAQAQLTIRDKTRDLVFPFRFVRDGATARLTATVTLQRLDYDVGTGDWRDTGLIANAVEVSVDLPLVRAAAIAP